MRVLIKVTKEVLERSKMCPMDIGRASINCAISVAVRDLFPNASIIYGECRFFGTPDKRSRSKLPRVAKEFISDFDDNTPEERVKMQPLSFEIEVPEYVIEKIGIGEIYRVLSESRTLELVMPKETTI